MKRTRLVLIFIAILTMTAFTVLNKENANDNPVHQLRIYTVPAENIDVFHTRFRDHAHRIMKKYGFNIVGTWESRFGNKVEFVYLLEWQNQAEMEDAWKKFMDDQEWKDIKKETSAKHGIFVEAIEDRVLVLTDYSPRTYLLER